MINREQILKLDAVLMNPIEDIELDSRSYNCLKRHGINRIFQILLSSDKDLLKIRNLGEKSLFEIRFLTDKYIKENIDDIEILEVIK